MREGHAEADAVRSQPVRRGHEARLAAPRDEQRVHLAPRVVGLDDRLLRRRGRERRVEVCVDVVLRAEQEDAALAR